MIKVQLNPRPLDPTQRVSNLLALVFREFAEQRKTSTVVEVHCKPEDQPVRPQLRLLAPKNLKGASRRKLPSMTRQK